MESDKKNFKDLIPTNIDILSYFDNDSDFTLVYKKTEKLAGATYMVTNLFSDIEPMKWNLRKKSSELLSHMINYKNVSEVNQTDFIYNARTQVLEMTSLLEISLNAGLLSVMNFSILKQEFLNLVGMLDTPKNVLRDFLSGHNLKNYIGSMDASADLRDDSRKIYNNVVSPSNTSKMSFSNTKDKTHILGQSDFKKSTRQNTIISILRKKKEVTINDLALVIKDCSEKTIQRELNSFISKGIIRRAGVRRWSRYSLA